MNPNIVSLCCAIALLVLATGSAVADDTLELTNGGSISGKAQRVDNTKAPYTLVELEDGLRVAIKRGDIRRTNSDEVTEQYRQLAAKVPDEAEAQFEMARWCSKNHLRAQSRYHMRRVIELDSNHGTAREALGFVKRRDEWIPRRQWEQERGLVRAAGKYQLPEDVALQAALKEADVRSKKWGADIARMRMAALRGGEKGAEAIQALRAIQDPLAAVALKDELTDPRNRKQPLALRLLWVDLLGRMQSPVAVSALVRTGVKESDAVVREAAIEKLQNYGYRSAVLSYLPMLKSPNNQEVNAAGRALADLPDPEARFELVDALITEHVTAPTGPTPEMNATFGQGGGGGLQMGGKPKAVPKPHRNPHVHAALLAIAPEVDFGYDEERWRQYFAAQLGTYTGDLRRDP